ncbi:DUF5642 family protein [Mycolicibacillus trivialis]|uniref:DUF5642 domain-containing protein n=1 Tax=Mycolicibacillus trivialis TaxID=1798 RepID=A0A1X2EL43_9MYCO|nr:DUF5642 family protein [Mycolicibacillus trivialis]ORX05738.1 hypothetical protein AWC30_07840 [Mycolicibacillus trivialis]
MLTRSALLILIAACWLGGCSWRSDPEITSADIAKITEIKDGFGPGYEVKDIAKTGIDPKLLAERKLPEGLKFEPEPCEEFAAGQKVPDGTEGNMAAVTAEGHGNRFIVIALETSQPVPFREPGHGCKKVGFAGKGLRGVIEAVDAPRIKGTETLGVRRILQASMRGKTRTGELYDYSAHFGNYQVIVTANPLVIPNQPVAEIDTERAKELLVNAVAAVTG